MTIPGIYGTSSSAPSSIGWANYPSNFTGYLIVESHAGILVQIYITYNNVMFFRTKFDNASYSFGNWWEISMTQIS